MTAAPPPEPARPTFGVSPTDKALRRAPDASRLSPGARAHLPARDGEPFFVALPVSPGPDPTVAEVRRDVVEPILAALGFDPGDCPLVDPPGPVQHPRADVAALARAIEFEYAANPKLQRRLTGRLFAAMADPAQPDPQVDDALRESLGTTVAEARAKLEQPEWLYVFVQRCSRLRAIIDHAGVFVARRAGSTPHSVHGIVFSAPVVEGEPRLTAIDARHLAAKALEIVVLGGADGEPEEVDLLPSGRTHDGRVRLRPAYRVNVEGLRDGQPTVGMIWIDAETGSPLNQRILLGGMRTAPATTEASSPSPRTEGVRVLVYNRDAGVGTTASWLGIDAPFQGAYVLQRQGVMARIDYRGDGDVANDLTVPVHLGPDWTGVSPYNDAAAAKCVSGGNTEFVQINLAAAILRYTDVLSAQGLDPLVTWTPNVHVRDVCAVHSGLRFPLCMGFTESSCPDYVDETGSTGREIWLDPAQDNTVVAHEMGHRFTALLTTRRQSGWCGQARCPKSLGLATLEDLADFWASHLESTNCFGGWMGKNSGGVDHGLHCANPRPGDGVPRRHDVTLPFDVSRPSREHFPESRRLHPHTLPYVNGGIAAAALWEARASWRSRRGPLGHAEFGIHLQRALTRVGFVGEAADETDAIVYRAVYEVLLHLVNDIVATLYDADAAHEALAGFARAGLFLIPPRCLAATGSSGCLGGDGGPDAVVAADDGDPTNDVELVGVKHRESHYLAASPPPFFHVWTGPRYRFDATGAAIEGAAPCHRRFMVEVSLDPRFPADATLAGPWRDAFGIDHRSGAVLECYGVWSPDPSAWAGLLGRRALAGAQATPSAVRVYYRARTSDGQGQHELLSTEPGGGLWTVPPPSVVVTADGVRPF